MEDDWMLPEHRQIMEQVCNIEIMNKKEMEEKLEKIEEKYSKQLKYYKDKEKTEFSTIALTHIPVDWDILEGEYPETGLIKEPSLTNFHHAFSNFHHDETTINFMLWTNVLRNQQYSNLNFNYKLLRRVSRLQINSFVICLRRKTGDKKLFMPRDFCRIILKFVSYREETEFDSWYAKTFLGK